MHSEKLLSDIPDIGKLTRIEVIPQRFLTRLKLAEGDALFVDETTGQFYVLSKKGTTPRPGSKL